MLYGRKKDPKDSMCARRCGVHLRGADGSILGTLHHSLRDLFVVTMSWSVSYTHPCIYTCVYLRACGMFYARRARDDASE